MNLREYLKHPQPPPESGASRMVLKRAIDSGTRVRQERLIYYYWYGWFDALKGKWTIRDVYIYLAINFSRKSKDFGGRDKDPAGLRAAARYLDLVSGKMTEYAETLRERAEKLEGEDSPTEATD